MGDLIDTTEMYLKTVYELEEEGIPALRARIVERLGQSGPTVSETVARLERDGLLRIGEARRIKFTAEGLRRAKAVMRRHRLAERLLLDVIKLDWAQVHEEACRWEHVLSDDVANRIAKLLEPPFTDPYGNLIPGVTEGDGVPAARTSSDSVNLWEAVARLEGQIPEEKSHWKVERISERVQAEPEDLRVLDQVGVYPGVSIRVLEKDGDVVVISATKLAEEPVEQQLELPRVVAEGVCVRPE